MSDIVLKMFFKSDFFMVYLSIDQHSKRKKMCHSDIDKNIRKKHQMQHVTKMS